MRKTGLFVVIDVGTNNVLFLLARRHADNISVIKRSCSVSRMGRYISSGRLSITGIAVLKRILKDYISYARIFTDDIIVVATSGSRQVTNITELSGWMKKRFGLRYQIISGEQEARLNGLANSTQFPSEQLLLFDIGGGSTEFTQMNGDEVTSWASLPLGIRRLDAEFGHSMTAKQDAIRCILLGYSPPELTNATLVGVGGTATSLAAIQLGLQNYDANIVHKSSLTISQCETILNNMCQMSKLQRVHALPFEPERAEIIATGTLIVYEILTHLGRTSFYVSDRGLQFGILNLPEDEFSALL